MHDTDLCIESTKHYNDPSLLIFFVPEVCSYTL